MRYDDSRRPSYPFTDRSKRPRQTMVAATVGGMTPTIIVGIILITSVVRTMATTSVAGIIVRATVAGMTMKTTPVEMTVRQIKDLITLPNDIEMGADH